MRRRFLKNGKSFDFSNYMTFEVLVDGFSFNINRNVEYSCNGGEWKTLQMPAESPSFFKGDFISIKCVLKKGERFSTIFTNGRAFNLRGNALSLIFGDEISDNIEGYDNVFEVLFASNVGLKHVDKGFLPAKILSDGCYQDMFSNSTIETAPELPATTLAYSCYSHMFESCRALTTAPELPATILVTRCYEHMFDGCTKLNYIKMLATDISASYCLQNWVTNVSSTGTFVKNPEATWDVVGDSGVPSGWTVKFDGEEEGNDYGIEFPLYLEFDYCESFGLMKTCYRNADELGVKLYNLIVDVIDKYGEAIGVWKTVSEEVLNSLGIEIYVEGNKVKMFNSEQGLYDMSEPDADYPTTIVESNGELVKEYM